MAQSELKTKSISVFKNGKSFVIKEGEVPATNNVYTLNKIPNALFGTLWFTGLQADIVQVTSKLELVDEPIERKATSFTDLLYANKGKQLTLTTNDDKIYTGIVEDYDLPELINNSLQLKETELREKYGSIYNDDFRLLPPGSSVLLLKMGNKWVSIAPANIKTIEFAEKPEKKAKLSVNIKKPVIKIQFTKSGNQVLSLMYLQNGISWMPTYLLELVSDTEARLKLQAEVVNNAEDITNTNMNFVVGVPNFKFADEAATLTSFMEKASRSFDYDSRSKGNIFSNAIMTQVVSDYNISKEDDNNSKVGDVEADASEDFYFYTINNINLEKGTRAHYPLFNIPVKIKHFYECNLSPTQKDYRGYNSDDSQLSFDIKYCNVYHSIEIKNDTKTPFTTGSAMIMDSKTQRPLSQDLIKYTGVGQASSIQLAQSPDIKVQEQEKIISTQPDAKKKKNGYSYNLLTIQSEVTVVNSKKQDIDMVIYKQITGKSKTATVKYDSKQKPSDANNVNPQDNLTFNLSIKAGQKMTFTYTYEMYVEN